MTTRRALSVAGWLLLALWAAWWGASLAADRLVGGSKTWVPRHPFLGVDFLHNYHGVRAWWGGTSPYSNPFNPDDAGERYVYPPLTLRLFAWCVVLPGDVAVRLWLVALAIITGVAAWECWRVRGVLGLGRAPFPLVLACVLWSTPFVYAFEHGNFDLVVLLLLLGMSQLLTRATPAADYAAGLCLAAAAGLKVYPALAGVVLIALRRPRAVVAAAAGTAAVVLLDLRGLMEFAENLRTVMARHVPSTQGAMHESMHSLTGCWPLLWRGVGPDWLAELPGWLAWVVLIGPPVVWVSGRFARCTELGPVLLPYLLWVTAAATFLPSVSNDYNLVFLPLAALVTWDRRDGLAAHLLLALLLVWWQPFLLPLGPRLLFACKLAGLYGVAICLAKRMAACGSGAGSSRGGRFATCPADRLQTCRREGLETAARPQAAVEVIPYTSGVLPGIAAGGTLSGMSQASVDAGKVSSLEFRAWFQVTALPV